jgi:hypothetical protein
MAMASDLITADSIDASEFPELADQYQVYGVPLTVANEVVRIEGGMPEQMFVEQIMSGLEDNDGSSHTPKILVP